jgi:eukaryotic-like serine/threonine-protein kinase
MHPERWRRVEELYHSASEREPGQRADFLSEACAGDETLRREVESLLERQGVRDALVDRPVWELAEDLFGTPGGEQIRAGSTQLGPYRILDRLGAGGMGEVFRAVDTRLDRPVAVKFLSPELANERARSRFQQEARMASALNHPHILTVHEAGEFEGRQYLVTEFVDGGTLREWARRTKPGWRQAVELLVGVADGLACAHEAGILHRDMKPDNILVARNGYAKLADFGLAKLLESEPEDDRTRSLSENRTRPGMILGTIAYMSPEQASGRPVDRRSDIFSFGVVLYEVLTGRRPFTGATDLELIQTIIHRPAALAELPTDLPIGLRMALEKALEKEPAERYQSMRDLVVDLRRPLRQSGETTASATAPAPRRHRWRLAAAVAVLALVAAAGLWRVVPRLGGSWLMRRSTATAAKTPNPEAYRAYLKGMAFPQNAGRTQIQTGIRYLEDAIRLDPAYGDAWAGLAVGYMALTFFGDVPARETMAQAKSAARKALELDPSNSRSLKVLAEVSHCFDWDHAAADQQFRKALDVNPQDWGAMSWFAEFLIDMRRFDEAFVYAKRAQDMNPTWLEGETVYGNIHYFSGSPDLAIPEYLRVLESDPNLGLAHHFLGRAYLAKGQHGKAIEQLRRSNELLGQVPFSMGDLGYALAVGGGRAEAEKMLSEILHKREQGYYPAFAIAEIQLGLGRVDAALDWLERGSGERYVGYYSPSVDPIYNPIRTHPRFRKLMQRMNFPE